MVTEWLHIACINQSPGSARGIGSRKKTPNAIHFRVIDICPQISIQVLNLHGLFIDLGDDFRIISWSWMIFFRWYPGLAPPQARFVEIKSYLSLKDS